jgi:hypothetical protein
MTPLLPFLLLGLLLLVLLVYWAWRSGVYSAGAGELDEAQEALDALQLELLPRPLVAKIFSPQDWEYISTHTSPQIQRRFERERRAIALAWLRQTRGQVGRLMVVHRRIARQSVSLSPAVELRLAAHYFVFLLACDLLLGLIWLRGPLHAGRLVGRTVGASERLCALLQALLASIDPARLARVKSPGTGRSGTS